MSRDDTLASLIRTYHELNACVVDVLTEVPSSLTFMRYVAKNRPFIVRQAAYDIAAFQKWDASYLSKVMGHNPVKVAITPHGNADSIVVDHSSNEMVFVEPYEMEEPFVDVLNYIQRDTEAFKSNAQSLGNVKYAQTQNDNLREEYASLFSDIPTDIGFASEALEKKPDAINFWLGNERSTTSLHKDPYENIYVQLRGDKHFVLLPPVEMPTVRETPMPRAHYQPSIESAEQLEIVVDHDADHLPVPTWDPDGTESTPYRDVSRALRITLHEGDIMYLPALWYHKVGQSSGREGFSCSVNYWYDMEFGGSFWASSNFVREVYAAVTNKNQHLSLDDC